jgi:amino acid permease
MSPKAYVRPGKTASVMGIIAASAMLLFGIVFFLLLQEDGSGIGQIFIVFWMLMIVLIIVYNVYNLKSQKGSSAALEVIDLDMADSGSTIEEKLRSLERMKKDQLITEEEYLQKRKEIMRQKW